MNINSKLNWTLVSSILAVVLSTTILLMWCCNVGGFSVVSLDTFVGVIIENSLQLKIILERKLIIVYYLVLYNCGLNMYNMRYKLIW